MIDTTRTCAAAKLACQGLIAALTFGMLTANAGLALHEERLDPLALYGERLAFDVWRNGERVGEHLVVFHSDGDALKVRTQVGIEVKVLFLKAYRFTHSSTAVWHDGRLKSLRAMTDDDGDRREVTVEADDEAGTLRLHDGQYWNSVPSGTFPSNHWHVGVLHQHIVINTLTGEASDVRIIRLGEEMIETANGTLSATRYAYSGDIDTEVWYDDRGRWVKMRFRAEDGSSIEYRCRTCAEGALSLFRQ